MLADGLETVGTAYTEPISVLVSPEALLRPRRLLVCSSFADGLRVQKILSPAAYLPATTQSSTIR